MRGTTTLTTTCALLTLLAGACFAQNESPKYFRLDFGVQEVDGGKVTNARHYVTTVSTDKDFACTIRTGSKVPVQTGGSGDSGQYTYIDLGVSFDCRSVKEIQGKLALNVAAEISSAVTTSMHPVVRQNKWNANVIVPLRKPTVIFSSDDLTTKGQMQVELTATPIEEH